MGKQIKLTNVRLNWPQLLTPKTSRNFPNNPPTYSTVVLLDPKTHAMAIKEVQGAMEEVAKDMFKAAQYTLPPSWKADADGVYELRVSCQEARPPQVVDQAVQPVYDEAKFYSGCFANVVIDIYATNQYGNKVSAGLLMVQFAADGERLDNRPKVEDLFQAIPVSGNTGDPLG